VGLFKVVEINKKESAGLASDLQNAKKQLEKQLKKKFKYAITQPDGTGNLESVVKDFVRNKKKNMGYKSEMSEDGNPYVQLTSELGIYHSVDVDRKKSFLDFFGPDSQLVIEIKEHLLDEYKKYCELIVRKTLKSLGLQAYENDAIFTNLYAYTLENFFNPDKIGETAGHASKLIISSPYLSTAYNFTTRHEGGINFKRPGGQITIDVLETIPILLAYKEMKKTPNYDNIGLDKKQCDAIMKEYESSDDKTKALAYYQGQKIKEILTANKGYKLYRGKNSTFQDVKRTGIQLYVTKQHGEALSPDNYNPSDFFLIRKGKNDKEATNLTTYNHRFANDLVDGEKVNSVRPKFIYIGVSQKKGQESRGGRAGEYFSLVKASVFGPVEDLKGQSQKVIEQKLKIATQELINVLNPVKDFVIIDDKTKSYKKFISPVGNLVSKYKIIKSLYNLCTEGDTTKIVEKEFFIELVKFSISMKKELNPCYYKLVGGDLTTMNPEQMEVQLNENEQVKIIFEEKGRYVILYIPIIFHIDMGKQKERKERYKIELPFLVKGQGFEPMVQRIENAEKVDFKDLASIEKKRSGKMLTGMGYGEKEFSELNKLWLGEMSKTWFRKYRKLVYDWMLKKIDDGSAKGAVRIKKDIKAELDNIDTGSETREDANDRYHDILAAFKTLEGVDFNERKLVYTFRESFLPPSNKITEILDKLDQYK
jgi:hypothetical protein